MLTYVKTFKDYKDFLVSQKGNLSYNAIKHHYESKKIRSLLWKLGKLDTDPIRDYLLSLYSQIYGRPAIDPLIFIRSFICMLRLKVWSIDEWCRKLKNDPVLQYLIGTWNPPSVASHYDFINRIMKDDPNMKTFFPARKNTREVKVTLKKDEKWENYDEEDTKTLLNKYKHGAEDDRERVSYVMEQIFNLLVVEPSIQKGLIDTNNLILSGDGSCVHIHSSQFGHKVHDAPDPDVNYRYTAPDADNGWDSDIGHWYFGYTMYNISNYNPVYKTDLPVYISLAYASTHDSMTTIPSVARMLDLNPKLLPKYMCLDSAMDSVNIFKYLRYKTIIPIIDLNKRHYGSDNPYAALENRDNDGTPLCAAGHRMTRDGYDNSKMATKFRCPVKTGKLDECPLLGKCSTSPYGRVIKLYEKHDYKLNGPIPYKSDEWKEIYKNRTCTERINNRILNDYGLHKMMIRNRSKFLFFILIAGINIHLDAWFNNLLL